jgi:hypothetical protein
MKKGNLAFHAAFHPKKKNAFPSKGFSTYLSI